MGKVSTGYKHSDLSAASNYGETNVPEKVHFEGWRVIDVMSECVSR